MPETTQPKPDILWAVYARWNRRTRWTLTTSTLASNRRDAIRQYCELWTEERSYYDREQRRGLVRTARVLVQSAEDLGL